MRRATITSSGGKGVLDPDLSERNDLAHYFNSVAAAMNTIFAPQGGFMDRGGSTLVSDADVLAAGYERRLRRQLEPIPITAGMLTSNGGTAASVLTLNTVQLQTSSVITTPFTALQVDFGVAKRVDAVDLLSFGVTGTSINETLVVEYFDGSAWQAFGGSADNAVRKHVRGYVGGFPVNRSRRWAGWPGYGITARLWRVALYGAVGAANFMLDCIRFWKETAVASPRKLVTITRSADESYQLVVTAHNIDVFRKMRWQAAIPIDILPQQIALAKLEASLDTVMVFEENFRTQRIVRQGSTGEWDVGDPPWGSIPNLNKGTAYSGSQDEIQVIGIGTPAAGAQIIVDHGTTRYGPFTYSNDAAFAAALQAAISSTDCQVTAIGGGKFRVAFVNSNGSRAWPLLKPFVLGATVAVPDTEVAQRGLDAASGSLFGDTTGWPRCGAFVQSRLLLAGFRGAPLSWCVSVVANYFDLQGGSTADKGFVRSLDVGEIETILDVYVGRHIQFFTESSEWFIEARTLDATQAQNAVIATRNGIANGVPVTMADGSTIFVQKGGNTLRDFLYTNVEQSYTADPLSVLAPHLLTGVVDMAHRKARSVREGNRLVMINADGSAACLTLLKSQDVIALAPWTTPFGAYRCAAVDVDHELYLIVERDGEAWLERAVPHLPLDASTTITGTAMTTIGPVPFPDGRQVWAYADDALIGPLTVASHQVVLPVPADNVTVGLAPDWFVRLQVERAKPNEERPFKPPMRIYDVDVALVDTGDLTIGVNGKPRIPVPLMRTEGIFLHGGPLQTETGGNPALPLMQRLYTGNRRICGLTGWTEYAYVELGREIPAPVHVKSIRREIAYNG